MLSHTPARTGFDSRLSDTFFEESNTALFNLVEFRKKVVSSLFNDVISTKVPARNTAHIIPHLLALYAPIFNLGELNPPEITDNTIQEKLVEIQYGLLPNIKNQLTLEFILHYIMERRIGYQSRVRSAGTQNLSALFETFHRELEFYGSDDLFQNPFAVDGKSYNELAQQIYSEFMISLLERLSNQGCFNLANQCVLVSASAVAFKLSNCKTVTLIYVIENGARKCLLTYIKQPGKKNCDKLIDDPTLLIELIEAMPAALRFTVLQDSFSDGYLPTVIKTATVLEAFADLFSMQEQLIIRAQFASVNFFNFDPLLTKKYFTPVTHPDERVVTLEETLMRNRRSLVSTKLLQVLSPHASKEDLTKLRLANEVLSCFSRELAIIQTEKDKPSFFKFAALREVVDSFISQEVPRLLSLSYVVRAIYQVKLISPLTELSKGKTASKVAEDIETLLNYYGTDAEFSGNSLFQNGKIFEIDELEWRISITLVHRLANAGFVDLTKCEIFIFLQDTIYFFPNNGSNISYVNNQRIPLIKYLQNLDVHVLQQILTKYPVLIPVLADIPYPNLSTFYNLYGSTPAFISTDYYRFISINKGLSIAKSHALFVAITSDILEKLLTDSSRYLAFIKLVPDLLRGDVLNKIPLQQFKKLHSTNAELVKFLTVLSFSGREIFLLRLDDDYLQNIHPSATSFLHTVKLLIPATVKPFCNKLGDEYLQFILNATETVYHLRAINQLNFYAVCKSFSDEHSRRVFVDKDSLKILDIILENKKIKFMIKLINAGCGCYQSLFSNLDMLADLIKKVPDFEAQLVKRIKRDLNTITDSPEHLFRILATLTQSKSRLLFCLSYEKELSSFITNFDDFHKIYLLLDDEDKILFELKSTQFSVYFKDIDIDRIKRIKNVKDSLSVVMQDLEAGKSSNNFTRQDDIDSLDQIIIGVKFHIHEVEGDSVQSPADQLKTLTLALRGVISILENAFKNKIPHKANHSFFAVTKKELFNKLNSNLPDFHLARFIGLTLGKLYANPDAAFETKDQSCHNTLVLWLSHLKKPMDKLLYLVPETKQETATSSNSLRAS